MLLPQMSAVRSLWSLCRNQTEWA